MSITFSQTARDVVTGAMRDLGIIPLSENPDAAELDYGVDQLNLMLKGLAAEGLTPWTDSEATAVVLAGTNTVTLDPRPVEVSDARVVDSFERYMQRWTGGKVCKDCWDPRPEDTYPPVVGAEGLPRPDAQPKLPEVDGGTVEPDDL